MSVPKMLDILGVDVLGVDSLGVDISAPTHKIYCSLYIIVQFNQYIKTTHGKMENWSLFTGGLKLFGGSV